MRWAGCEGRSTLLVPRLDAAYAVWMGEIKSCAFFKKRYFVDACAYTDELTSSLAEALVRSPGVVRVLFGTNSDSGANLFEVLPPLLDAPGFQLPPDAVLEKESLYEIAAECRVTKSADEIDLMRYVSWVSSMAHASVCRLARSRPSRLVPCVRSYSCRQLRLTPLACPQPPSPSRSLPFLESSFGATVVFAAARHRRPPPPPANAARHCCAFR